MTLRGIRNNNPGNIRASKEAWIGQVGIDDKGFVIFDTIEHGIRAMAKTLMVYFKVHNLLTVSKIIERWAPPEENNTEAYRKDVAQRMCVGIDEVLNLNATATMADLIQAICIHENGQWPYSLVQLNTGVALARAA